jgi:dTDP-4-amino-4,6-dideoxygalactose transaminase
MEKSLKWSIIMIQLFKVGMSGDVTPLINEVLLSGFIGQGPKVEIFEETLAKVLKTQIKPVTVNSCTSAIDLCLHLCDVQPGDEVIATPQTCFASQVGIIHRHAKIRWADIDPMTGLMDPESARKLITKKTKAIVAVNWAGRICDFKTLKSFGIPVIEDAAHTWDVFLKEPVERGDYICYSFQAIKFLTSGDGGLIICPNEEKEQEARILRWFGLDRTKSESFRCTQNITKAGYKYHMNDINATIGLANIDLANLSVNLHRKNAKYLIDNINNQNLVMPLWDETCSFWLFSMHVLNGRKSEFTKYLVENGIACSPVHYRNDLYDSTIHFKEKDLPGVTAFDETQVCIPVGWWLTEDNLKHIVNTLNNFN